MSRITHRQTDARITALAAGSYFAVHMQCSCAEATGPLWMNDCFTQARNAMINEHVRIGTPFPAQVAHLHSALRNLLTWEACPSMLIPS